MKRADRVIALILIGVSSYIFYDTSFYPEPLVPGAPGAAYFPRGLAYVLLVLAGLLLIQSWRAKKEEETQMGWSVLWKLGLTFILAAAFIFLLDVWDTFILIPILLAAVMVIMGERRIRSIVAVPLIFDLFIYVVFYRIFHVQLPTLYF
jgi:hypothetical protein